MGSHETQRAGRRGRLVQQFNQTAVSDTPNQFLRLERLVTRSEEDLTAGNVKLPTVRYGHAAPASNELTNAVASARFTPFT